MRRFLRFTIRDLLWLTLVVAVGLGWFVRERPLCDDMARIKAEADQIHAEFGPSVERARKWRWVAGALESVLVEDGWKVDWTSEPSYRVWMIRKAEAKPIGYQYGVPLDRYKPGLKDD